MPAKPPGMQRITAYLLYEDAGAAIEWLARAFGFRERLRIGDADGRVTHAELELADDGVVMLGWPGPQYRSPRRTGAVSQELYVYVDAVDEHYERAKAGGARILEEPTDQFYGDRRYRAVDPEGHHWVFAEHVRHVPPKEYGATTA